MKKAQENMENSSPYIPDKLYSRSYVRDLLCAHDIRLNKRRGQNFLIERNSIAQIIENANISSDDIVLEIGAGIGHLTTQLLHAARHVIAVEIDERFFPVLNGMCGGTDAFTLVHGDFMKIDIGARCNEIGIIPTKVVANVPYYITTPIVEKLHESSLPLKSITLTIQDDVARRYVAQPGQKEYSSISVVLNYWGIPKLCAYVPHGSFYPRPKVDSAIVHIDLHEHAPIGIANEALFYRVVRMAFHTRRKMIHNSLTALSKEGYAVKEALASAGISSSARPAELTLKDYARLTDALITSTALPTTE